MHNAEKISRASNMLALDTAKSVVVQACAGSGKTWLLSSRIARALVEGVPARSILALTFTNKAAAEMRNRVIGHLQEMAQLSQPELSAKLSDWGLSGEALNQAMDRAPFAFARFLADPEPPVICTFHSWYIKIAAMAPLSMAGAATMSLSTQPWDLMRRAWQLFFEEHVDQTPYAQLVKIIGGYNTREACEQWVRLQVEWTAFGAAIGFGKLTSHQALKAHEQALIENEKAITSFYQTHAGLAAELAKAFDQITGKEEFVGFLKRWRAEELSALTKLLLTPITGSDQLDANSRRRFRLKGGDSRFIRQGQEVRLWGSQAEHYSAKTQDFVCALIDLLDQNDGRLLEARTKMLWSCSQTLSNCLRSVMAVSHEIDFSGLESVAWDLLGGANAPDFHARLDTHIRHILVDEFQDTNPTQWAMLRAWLEQYLQDDPSVRDKRPQVFLVGDPKQSIYRFRRADPQVFQIAARWLKEHYGALEISANTTRRCGPEVTAFLNRAMPGLDAFNRYQPHETLATKNTGFVAWLPEAQNWQEEGSRIGGALKQIKADHPQLRWSDMRILVKTRTHVGHYERALAASGIPFVSDRAGGLLSAPEVRDLIALIRFLAFPWSDTDCAQTLKSPIFGLTDHHLAQIALHESEPKTSFYDRLKAFCATSQAQAELKEAQALLDQWINWATELPVHDLLDRIIYQHRVFDRMAARFSKGVSLQCIANIEAFMALALELDTGRLPSLARFLQELKRWTLVKDADAPGPGLIPNVDAVCISTMHGAKGLESEVVVLADLMDRDRSDAGLRWLINWNQNRDRILSVCSWQSSDPIDDAAWSALQDDAAQAQAEDFNLAYVGATRAKRILLFSATRVKKDADDSWFAKLCGFCDPWTERQNQENISAKDLSLTNKASELIWRGIDFDRSVPTPITKPSAETLALRQGKALHRLLEIGPGISEPFALRRLSSFGLPRESQKQVLEAVRLIAQKESVQIIFDPSKTSYAEREWPIGDEENFSLMRPDRIIQVSVAPEIWWIVDFKWSLLDSERADYVNQLSRYQEQFKTIRSGASVCAKILTAKAELWSLSGATLVLEKASQ